MADNLINLLKIKLICKSKNLFVILGLAISVYVIGIISLIVRTFNRDSLPGSSINFQDTGMYMIILILWILGLVFAMLDTDFNGRRKYQIFPQNNNVRMVCDTLIGIIVMGVLSIIDLIANIILIVVAKVIDSKYANIIYVDTYDIGDALTVFVTNMLYIIIIIMLINLLNAFIYRFKNVGIAIVLTFLVIVIGCWLYMTVNVEKYYILFSKYNMLSQLFSEENFGIFVVKALVLITVTGILTIIISRKSSFYEAGRFFINNESVCLLCIGIIISISITSTILSEKKDVNYTKSLMDYATKVISVDISSIDKENMEVEVVGADNGVDVIHMVLGNCTDDNGNEYEAYVGDVLGRVLGKDDGELNSLRKDELNVCLKDFIISNNKDSLVLGVMRLQNCNGYIDHEKYDSSCVSAHVDGNKLVITYEQGADKIIFMNRKTTFNNFSHFYSFEEYSEYGFEYGIPYSSGLTVLVE